MIFHQESMKFVDLMAEQGPHQRQREILDAYRNTPLLRKRYVVNLTVHQSHDIYDTI